MGLDMYLYRKTYVQNWDHMGPSERHTIEVKRGGAPRADIKPERIVYIIEQVAYWRKANAIHNWFVSHVQKGQDDCQESYVTKQKLCELLADCKQVLNTVETVDGVLDVGTTYHPDGSVEHHTVPGQVIAQPEFSAMLLPTLAGCFFGSTAYDEYYLESLKDTVKMLEPILSDLKDEGEYYYRASW